jgi:hypothetical protein
MSEPEVKVSDTSEKCPKCHKTFPKEDLPDPDRCAYCGQQNTVANNPGTSERVGAVDGDAPISKLEEWKMKAAMWAGKESKVAVGEKQTCEALIRLIQEGRFSLKPEASQETKPPQTADEFRKRLLNDPIAYAYYNLGRAVERDIRLTPEQRKRKNWDAICAAVNLGYAEKILPDIWQAELEDAE